MQELFICEKCGKQLQSKKALDGHQHTHSPKRAELRKRLAENAARKKALYLDNWIKEQHKCEKCGVIMTEKFGRGRFCSRKCANSHIHTMETRAKISQSVIKTCQQKAPKKRREIQVEIEYNKKPNHCSVCGKPLSYSKRANQTCGNAECRNKLLSEKAIRRIANKGLHQNIIDKRYKYGTYRGFQCDSSWELAFVVWAIDHGLNIKRNKECFSYTFNGASHNYFPDFVIDDIYYEVKGYFRPEVEAKIEDFPEDRVLEIIDCNRIKPYLRYAQRKFGKNFAEIYDRNYPSWMDHID